MKKKVFYNLFKILGRTRSITILLSIACAFSFIATYFELTRNAGPLLLSSGNIIWLLLLNLILLLSLVGLVARRLVKLLAARRQGFVGSRLQTRIVVMFSLIAIIPAIAMAIFSLLFLNFAIQAWFDEKVSTAIEGSVAVAEGYLEEHKKIIRADILGMANDLNRESFNLRQASLKKFNQVVALLAGIRKLPEAIVFKISKTANNQIQKIVIARTNFSYALEFTLEEISEAIIDRAEQGELATLTTEKDDRVIAMIKLDNYFDTYLLVGRFVDNKIINHIESTKGAASAYEKLKDDVSNLQIKFFAIFIVISLVLLVTVIWYGFVFAVKLVNPISHLVSATEKVKAGNWRVRVDEGPENDEIATLGRAFNRMTNQLEKQHKEIALIQTRAAWADVARRVAHEIKNPLTPIHLAAERLKRKYSGQVEDIDTFKKYTDTIIRHVNDIGKMVDEFANYARMPAPDIKRENICQLLKDVIFSRECGSHNIEFIFNDCDRPIIVDCDIGQIQQVLTNLIKNSEEAVLDRIENDSSFSHGKIMVTIDIKDDYCEITIKDNGCGFPESLLDKLTEPYITTKTKGTGLGLAIVSKIIEEHNGNIEFYNNNGAVVSLKLPIAGKK